MAQPGLPPGRSEAKNVMPCGTATTSGSIQVIADPASAGVLLALKREYAAERVTGLFTEKAQDASSPAAGDGGVAEIRPACARQIAATRAEGKILAPADQPPPRRCPSPNSP